MREDQERRFCALIQNQKEDRELFRSWMDREVRSGGISPAPALSTHMSVNKMGPKDDPEAFLDLFEKTAEACGWPQMNWPVRLILLNLRLRVSLYKQWGLVTSKTAILPPHCR